MIKEYKKKLLASNFLDLDGRAHCHSGMLYNQTCE